MAPGRRLAWAGAGDRGRCRRGGIRLHRRAASTASSASSSRRTWPRGGSWSAWVSPTGSPTIGQRGEEIVVTELSAHAGRRARIVGDIEQQTAVEPAGDGRFTAMVHDDWEIWGPCGGYVAALALRAAGAESPLARPASFFCHYLSVASFAPVDLEVTPLRSGRTVLAQRVAMTQEGRPVLDAMVWSVGEVEGLEHEDVDPPDVPDPDELPTWADLRPDEDRPAMRLLGQLRPAPDRMVAAVASARPLPPTWRAWVRASRRPRSRIPGWMRRARSLCSTWGAGPPARGPHVSRPAVHCAEPGPLRLVPVSRALVGLAAARRAFSGGPRWAVVVDRQGVVTGAPADRQRRWTGGLPAHLGAPGVFSRPSSRPSGPECAA